MDSPLVTNSRYALLAAAIMHIEGAFSIFAKAYRNNNPGNIKMSDGHFWIFSNKLAGFEHLLIYISRHSFKTVQEFIQMYAPTNENDTNAYLLEVLKLTGWQASDVISGSIQSTNERIT